MRNGKFVTNSRRYFCIEALWSVIYSGVAFVIFVYAAFSTPFFSEKKGLEPADYVLMVELPLFIMLTIAYIIFGKKRLSEWNGKFIACSLGIMISSFPAALILLKMYGYIKLLIINH